MGDTTTNHEEVTRKDADPEISTGTTNKLHPAENIASTKTPSTSQEKIEKIHDGTISGESLPKVGACVESTLEGEPNADDKIRVKKSEDERKPLIDTLASDTQEQAKNRFTSKSSLVTSNVEKKTRIGSAASGLIERINRNESDIFSLKEETSIGSSIFSVNGSPSRKVFRRRELTASNVFPFGQKEEPPTEKVPAPAPPREKLRDTKDSYNELKRPSSSVRNPLTGTGLNSNDEYKFKGNKRKDGNPLLGLGYSPEATPSAHRIPPGGYSHKLW